MSRSKAFATQTMQVGVAEMPPVSSAIAKASSINIRALSVPAPYSQARQATDGRIGAPFLVAMGHENGQRLPEVNRRDLWIEEPPARPMRVNPIVFSKLLETGFCASASTASAASRVAGRFVSLTFKNGPPIERNDEGQNAQLLSASDCPIDKFAGAPDLAQMPYSTSARWIPA